MLTSSMKAKTALVAQVYSHLRTPLYRNGYALTLGSLITSGLGIIYWAIAARYYTADIVGLSSSVISAMMLLAGIAVLTLSGVLVRFTPLAGPATQRLVIYSYGVSITAAFV